MLQCHKCPLESVRAISQRYPSQGPKELECLYSQSCQSLVNAYPQWNVNSPMFLVLLTHRICRFWLSMVDLLTKRWSNWLLGVKENSKVVCIKIGMVSESSWAENLQDLPQHPGPTVVSFSLQLLSSYASEYKLGTNF